MSWRLPEFRSPPWDDGRVLPDFAALTRPVTEREIADHKRAWRIRDEVGNTSIGWQRFGLVITFPSVTFIASMLTFGAEVAAGHRFVFSVLTDSGLPHLIIPALIGALVTVLLAIAFARGDRRESETSLRLSEFAADNGLSYVKRAGAWNYPSTEFRLGESREVRNNITAADQDYFELGNLKTLIARSDYYEATTTVGFLAILLDRQMQHMILDSKGNNTLGLFNALGRFSGLRPLSLEGDFDKYFTLYCVEGHERDALYVFTPDLMALVIDHAAPFDIEIIDEWMFMYVPGGLPVFHPRAFRRLFTIMDVVAAKALRQKLRLSGSRPHAGRAIRSRLRRVSAPRIRRKINRLWFAAALLSALLIGALVVRSVI